MMSVAQTVTAQAVMARNMAMGLVTTVPSTGMAMKTAIGTTRLKAHLTRVLFSNIDCVAAMGFLLWESLV